MTTLPARNSSAELVRHDAAHPCPVCGGHQFQPRGQGLRCSGYTVEGKDGAHCSRTESAWPGPQGTWWHPPADGAHTTAPPGGNGASTSRKDPRPWVDEDWSRIWTYCDADRRPVLQVLRRDLPGGGKDIRQRYPRADGGFDWKRNRRALPPYRLPELLEHLDDGETRVWIGEGEPCADALAQHGCLATTTPMGSKSWRSVRDGCLPVLSRFAQVNIVRDLDDAGKCYVQALRDDLVAAGCEVYVYVAATNGHGDDAVEHFSAGFSLDDFRQDPELAIEPEVGLPDGDEVEKVAASVASYTPRTKRYRKNDRGNNERLIDAHGEDLVHCAQLGGWHYWTGTHWRRDEQQYAESLAKQIADSLWLEVASITDKEEKKAAISWAKTSGMGPRQREALRLAESDVAGPPGEFDTDPMLLNVANGTLDLKTMKLREHRREDRITRCIDIAYGVDAQCPTWITFLERVIPDRATRDFLQRFVGYSLTGDVSEQCFLFLHGSGANGKSVFCEAIADVMGEYSRTTPFSTFLAKYGASIPNDLAALRGARCVFASEAGEHARWDAEKIKNATGGDTISARFMRAEWFSYRPTWKLIFRANDRPRLNSDDDAMKRRIRLVPFEVIIPEADRDGALPEKLQAERAGILAWLVEGCRQWRADGLREPQAVRDAVREYFEENDDLAEFLESCCELHPDNAATSKELREAYVHWCESMKAKPMSANRLGRKLTKKGYGLDRDNTGRRRKGLRVKLPGEA